MILNINKKARYELFRFIQLRPCGHYCYHTRRADNLISEYKGIKKANFCKSAAFFVPLNDFEHCKSTIYFLNGNGFLEKNVSLQEKEEK